jgi:hypothetical protein
MTMSRNKIYQWSAFGAFLLAASLLQAEQDKSQILLDLLVKRGVLSSSDAREFAKQADAVSAPAPDATAPTTNPTAAAAAATMPVVTKSGSSPLSFSIGNAQFTPLGFVDFTTVYRSTNLGSGIGTNFAGIPYSNTSAGQLSETRFSAQNSRIGLRIDSQVNDTKVMGYLESDFLGNAPTNLGVSSNAATMRMRVYFADLKWHNWEFLAGQDWSMLTPNRSGISALPSDIFFSLNMDTNYQAGLVWARQPQVRVIYHATDKFTAGISLENPDQYIGGTNGSSAVTLPTGFNAGEVDSGGATTAPNQMPDIIGKLAYDTKVNGLAWHVDVAGLYRSFKINTFTTGAGAINSDDTASGYGGSLNVNLELVKDLRFIGNAYVSKGGGRYVFGQAPDFVVNPPDASGAYSISTLSTESYLAGLEWQATPKTTLFGYYSTVRIGKESAAQSNGSLVGYGYIGSPNSQNKSIDEYTFGAVQTLWKNSNYGALQVIGQASYVDRKPWYVAPGAPSSAHDGMVFLDLRYVLP